MRITVTSTAKLFFSRLTSLRYNEIHQVASLLVREYHDFEDTFPPEIVHFAAFFREKAFAVAREEPMLNLDKHWIESRIEFKMFLLPNENQCVDTFYNVHVVLCIHLCIMCSNSTGTKIFFSAKED